jgi:hypothetical protein
MDQRQPDGNIGYARCWCRLAPESKVRPSEIENHSPMPEISSNINGNRDERLGSLAINEVTKVALTAGHFKEILLDEVAERLAA